MYKLECTTKKIYLHLPIFKNRVIFAPAYAKAIAK